MKFSTYILSGKAECILILYQKRAFSWVPKEIVSKKCNEIVQWTSWNTFEYYILHIFTIIIHNISYDYVCIYIHTLIHIYSRSAKIST